MTPLVFILELAKKVDFVSVDGIKDSRVYPPVLLSEGIKSINLWKRMHEVDRHLKDLPVESIAGFLY